MIVSLEGSKISQDETTWAVLVKKWLQICTRTFSASGTAVDIELLLLGGVVVAPQLAYTPANCSRQAAQAKPEGLLRLPRANQQHKKDSTIADAVLRILS